MKRSEIKIMGRSIPIVYKEMEDQGQFEQDELTIYINEKLDGQRMLDVIAHESLHCILALSGINEVISDETEEMLVQCLEYNYLDVVRSLDGMVKENDVLPKTDG